MHVPCVVHTCVPRMTVVAPTPVLNCTPRSAASQHTPWPAQCLQAIECVCSLCCVLCCRCLLASAVQSHVVGVYALHASLGACGAPQLLAQLDDAVSDTMREWRRPQQQPCVLRQRQGSHPPVMHETAVGAALVPQQMLSAWGAAHLHSQQQQTLFVHNEHA